MLAATLLRWKWQHFYWIFTIRNRMMLSELQRPSQYPIFASSTPLSSQPFLNQSPASNFQPHLMMAPKESNRPSLPWSTSPSLSHTPSWMIHFKMMRLSIQLYQCCWRISRLCWEVRPYSLSCFCSRWIHNGWLLLLSKTSIKTLTNSSVTITNMFNAASSAWSKLWAQLKYQTCWPSPKIASHNSYRDSWRRTHTSLWVLKRCRIEMANSLLILRVAF